MQGLIGKKLGMTQVYDPKGVQVPVTVIQVGPCVVVQRKTREKDGYDAAQLGFAPKKEQRASKALIGHAKKAGATPFYVLREFDLDKDEQIKEGDTLTASVFKDIDFVDIVGTSKGKGFQGVVRRHGMGGGRITHGSTSHRRVGAIGMKTWPSRVLRGQRMPGHQGAEQVTVQNLKVVQVREEDNVILVNGATPGPTGGTLLVRKSLKRPGKAKS